MARPLAEILPEYETPEARLSKLGGGALSNTEILAILIGGKDRIERAAQLISEANGDMYHARHWDSLQAGLTPAQANRIEAALELGRRYRIHQPDERPVINSPADAAALMQYEMSCLEQEELRVILCDTRNRVMRIETVCRGSGNSSSVHLGELFQTAVRYHAIGIVVIHNHPSGDPTPSPDDIAVTRAIVQAGKLLDVVVLDHLIIGRGRFVSLKERGLGFS